VAKLAGLPPETVGRARQILSDLEEGILENGIQKELRNQPSAGQKSFLEDGGTYAMEVERIHNPVKEELEKIDTNNMTPMEALQRLSELKRLI